MCSPPHLPVPSVCAERCPLPSLFSGGTAAAAAEPLRGRHVDPQTEAPLRLMDTHTQLQERKPTQTQRERERTHTCTRAHTDTEQHTQEHSTHTHMSRERETHTGTRHTDRSTHTQTKNRKHSSPTPTASLLILLSHRLTSYAAVTGTRFAVSALGTENRVNAPQHTVQSSGILRRLANTSLNMAVGTPSIPLSIHPSLSLSIHPPPSPSLPPSPSPSSCSGTNTTHSQFGGESASLQKTQTPQTSIIDAGGRVCP